MATYYLDGPADFVDRSGADKTGNELTGPGGFQAAIRGTGLATVLAAGDTLVIKAGTLAIDRLILFDCNGTDVSAWQVGDTVVDNNTGSEWTGKVVQERDLISTGLAADDILLVQLDSAFTHADITDGSGINNTTAVQTSTLASADINPVLFDTLTPTGTNPVEIIGCSSGWTEKGDTNGTIIDGSAGADTAGSLWDLGTGTVDYLHVWNVTFQNTSSHAMAEASGTSSYWWFIHCKFDAIAGQTPSSIKHLYTIHDRCIFANLTGYIYPSSASRFFNCVVRDCSGTYAMLAANSLINVRFDANTQEILVGAASTIWGCVIDGTSAGDDVVKNNSGGVAIMASRIVNAQATFYGIDASAAADTYENFNVFYNPLATSDLESVTSGANSYGQEANHISDPADDGIDADFNVEDGKEHDSTEIIINWDGA